MKAPHFRRRLNIGAPPYRLDIGCKRKRLTGFIGIDIEDFGQDVVWNVLDGLPFPDNSVTTINMGDFLEHIGDSEQPKLWQEIRRVCRHEAVITIKTPHADTIEAWDVCHESRWTPERFHGLARCWNRGLEVTHCARSGAHIIATLVVQKTKEHKC